MISLPELLSPAGSRESFQAALTNGADAIYLGSGRLNARGDKAQFQAEELPDLIHEAHRNGAKVYLALNILLFDSELTEALALARSAAEAGVDACIVQDRGLMRRLSRELPSLPIHASTQCTAGTREAIAAYKALGCSRVCLPRELSLEEIKDLTSYAHSIEVETEIFLHGALCMSVSGQCHMSHFMGGRGANRGDCAQSCRKTYKILRNGAPFRKEGAWLSPKDLGGFGILAQLLETGVDSCKIEGRLRNPDYVGQVTATYRKAIDEMALSTPADAAVNEARKRDLLLAFNRGGDFTTQYWLKNRSKDFLSGEHTSHRGILMGEVTSLVPDKGLVQVRRNREIPPEYLPQEGSQMTLRTLAGEDLATAPCGRIRQAQDPGVIEFQGFHPQILRKLQLPIEAWQMGQPRVTGSSLVRERKPALSLTLQEDEGRFTLTLEASDKRRSYTDEILDPPPKRLEQRIPAERCAEQLRKLGDTPYVAGEVRVESTPAWRISDLNRFRREALSRFVADENRQERKAPGLREPQALAAPEFPLVIALPFWQAGREIEEVLCEQKGLLLLPAGELALLSDQEFLDLRLGLGKETELGALLPPEKIPAVSRALETMLVRLLHLGLKAVATGPSGLPELTQRLGLQGLAVISWQGGQLWNEETAVALAGEGYTHALVSPELEPGKGAALAETIQRNLPLRPLLWAYGRTQAMFTRFCPVGFSKGKDSCTLCTEAQFAFEDDRGRVFPLRPQRELDCSFEVWQSEALPFVKASRDAASQGITLVLVFTDEEASQIAKVLREVGDCVTAGISAR